MQYPFGRTVHIQYVGKDLPVGVCDPDSQRMCGAFYAQRKHGLRITLLFLSCTHQCNCWYGLPITRYNNKKVISHLSGPWSRGYDVALTLRRSPVQIRPGPPSFTSIMFRSEHSFEFRAVGSSFILSRGRVGHFRQDGVPRVYDIVHTGHRIRSRSDSTGVLGSYPIISSI